MAEPADVSAFAEVGAMIKRVLARWGRIDILVNNAGILRDRSFAKMAMADFEKVIAVHLVGSANCCRAVWEHMREQRYGRIGLMATLQHEGANYGIRVNCLAPLAMTGMTDGLLAPEDAAQLTPEAVSPAVVFMASEQAPEKTIMGAGAGVYSVVHVVETEGVYLPPEARSPADFHAAFAAMSDISSARHFDTGFDQAAGFINAANRARSAGGG